MISVAILTISDAVSRGERRDASGDNVVDIVARLDATVRERRVTPDEADLIAEVLRGGADGGEVDLVLTTGGTGLGPRDVTPEATKQVIEREVPGLAETMRLESARSNVHAILSRAVVGTRGKTLIVNLPGSPSGVVETLELLLPVLPHAIDILKGKQADHTPPGHDPHHGHGSHRTPPVKG